MKVLGNRVYVKAPKMPESKVILTGEALEKHKAEMMAKFDTLEVFATGTDVTNVKVGDMVHISPSAINKAGVLEINKEGIIMVSLHDVNHIW